MNFLKQMPGSKVAIPFVLLTILGMVILPLPPFLLDVLFTFNITLAILVLLKSTSTTRVLQFSVFPTLLLVATLMRLTLNVASTRIVLLEGHNGPEAAGKVIQSFGEVAIGGSYVVGIVVFAILMIINFMVVTKGGERISEVSARFTLDALPGKQMAIDADLNSGLISQEDAVVRRKEISEEAEFHGAMDGASKFVKGDAIAGLLILIINLVGGILIGILEHGLDIGTAFKTYGLLTIGDGLVAQIPSLLLATASAILVTRINDNDRDVAQTIDHQITKQTSILYMAAGVMFVIGSVPNMPHIAFYTFAFGLGALGFFSAKRQVIEKPISQEDISSLKATHQTPELSWGVIPIVNPITLNLGMSVIPMATSKGKNPLLKSLKGCRKTLSEKAGFLIPEITIKDDFSLSNSEYAILIDGDLIAKGKIYIDHLMAIGGEIGKGDLNGILDKDPAYGMQAIWINPDDRQKAISLGYNVIDPHDVIATHLSKICAEHLSVIFNFDDVKGLNDRLRGLHPELAETLEKSISPNLQMLVIRQLLSEQVPIANVRTIANSIIETVEVTKDPILIASNIRQSLRRTIMNLICGESQSLQAFTMSEEMVTSVNSSLQLARQSDPNVPLDAFSLENDAINKLRTTLPSMLNSARNNNTVPVLIVEPILRPIMSKMARVYSKGVIVISMQEIPEDYNVVSIGNI
ncbi:flagellar biosynthesis protein FlhA [Vibrio barjaei]|uniref:flagellar biosynthesis protein FlhA n=1 Tax=Vibrio barjaei TaxID=1676683 RepID=UPI002283B280|nr:flagellar biosynthesis protein FlhA [Vibrio barjaei]MCY9872301.1 flagellar biosynthesis protein FlhA [Vibrio barjaei]